MNKTKGIKIMTKKYYETVKNLDELFDTFNAHLFNNELEKPVITVSPDLTSGAYGWCTAQKIWKSSDEEFYEINICAEHLNRDIKEICGILIHEMVHLDNINKEIQDTSANGRYHNKKFKETAEAHGLVIEKMGNVGWSETSLSEELATWIDENIKIKGFDLVRTPKMKKGSSAKKSKYKYYMCPCCETKFYSVHTINAICEDCGNPFVQYK